MLSQDTAATATDDKILHLRNFPVDLHSRLKSKAALEGIPMRDLVIDVLWKSLNADNKKPESRRAS